MRILADENIAELAEWFGTAGDLRTLPGRAISAASLRDVDVLLVRSVTRVDAALLTGSPCRFVGTTTSGIDHVDTAWLAQQGIGFGWARGCNANAVAEYVLCALAQLSERYRFDWRQRSVGIIGCGEVGSRLARKLLALGLRICIHDPYLDEHHGLAQHFGSLDAALQQDVVTLHTPLTRNGRWPTWHLLDARRLAQLGPDRILINAARGSVVDNQALLQQLVRSPERLVVLDAWEGEPALSPRLLAAVAVGTAHIAGYSQEGKRDGTRLVAEAFGRHFGPVLQGPPAAAITERLLEPEATGSALGDLNRLLLMAYDIGRDHQALHALLREAGLASGFDLLRKHYPARHEFAAFEVDAGRLAPEAAAQAAALGFRLLP